MRKSLFNLVLIASILLLQLYVSSSISLKSSQNPTKLFETKEKRQINKKYIVRKQEKSKNMEKISLIAETNSQPLYTTIFPVYPKELVKFFSLSFMMFWIIFVFTMTRDTKDTLIVTNCGAEAISFLKVYGVVPAAGVFMLIYSKLANYFAPQTLFYVILAPFFVFYMVFAFILYPMKDLLHPMSLVVPEGGLSYAVNLFRYWTFSLYYIVSELWGSAGVPLLFWSCANDVVKIDQAKRMYPLMSLIGNLGPILSGITMSTVSQICSKTFSNQDRAFEASLQVLTCYMVAAGGFIAGLHWFIHFCDKKEKSKESSLLLNEQKNPNITQNDEINDTVVESEKPKKSPKPKVSFLESLQILAADPYLRNVATMVLSYGLTMEFTEIIWKATVKQALPVKSDYLQFMGRYSTYVGTAATLMMFVGAKIVKGLGWRAGALMTPGMMGILAFPFFISIMGNGKLMDKIISQFTSSPKNTLLIAVYVGLIQNVFSKATKYAIFDPTKEMTYIPLDKDSKTKGKAAIDVLGARLGKSGGALIQQILVIFFGSIVRGAPIIATLFYVVIFAWIAAVNSLSPKFAKKSLEMNQTEKQKEA